MKMVVYKEKKELKYKRPVIWGCECERESMHMCTYNNAHVSMSICPCRREGRADLFSDPIRHWDPNH